MEPKKEDKKLPALDKKKVFVEEILEKSQISMWIDDYNDIFSDFDPRPYSKRLLSDDFLNEAKKVVKEAKLGHFELKFLVPASLRKTDQESMIKKRLRDYFRKQAASLESESRQIIKKGVVFTIVGFVLMIAASLMYQMDYLGFIGTIMLVIMEPSGWFSVWYGLDQIFYEGKKNSKEIKFSSSMTKADMSFESY